MILKEVIILSEKGDFLRDLKEGESFSLIMDFLIGSLEHETHRKKIKSIFNILFFITINLYFFI